MTTTVDENAFVILRLMREKGITLEKEITCGELKTLTGLTDEDFDQAEGYLLRLKYVTGGGGGDQASRWITPQGMEYVRQEMENRLPLSLDAERILKYVASNEPTPSSLRVFGSEDKHSVSPEDVKNALSLPPDDLNRALGELEDEGLACSAVKGQNIRGGWGIRTTPEGRQVIRRGFRIPIASSTQIGAIFHGPVTATNLVTALNSQIEQTISVNDPAAIQQAIAETLSSVIKSVADILDLDQTAAYTRTAAELQKELEKTEPDPTAIHKLIRVLSFGDTLDGTLELGKKALVAGARAAPYIHILYESIKQLPGLIG